MTAASPPPDPLVLLTTRLEGTVPRHDRETWRLGGALAVELLPELERLMPAEPSPAAVLVGIVAHPADPAVLLTVRAGTLRAHAGQIAFPGGRLERDESPVAAALREAREEIGLVAEDVQIIGYLPDHVVLTGFRVTPVVARLAPGALLRIDTTEVDQVFELPWSVLADDAHVHKSERSFGGVSVPMLDVHFGGHRIWGLTAAILLLLRDISQGVAP